MAGDDKANILRHAEKYVISGKILQAINEYLKIIKADPNDVLTLNTIGDLYLRQGMIYEATGYFSQVAESYSRNNFLLKAIAVYKKILNADPENLEINQTLSALLAKQGLHVEARNQYTRLAELLAKGGKTRESVEAYEKVVELDPMSSAVQLKLAQIYLSEGNRERALLHFTGAARAQSKAGDYKSAVSSYQRAMEMNPTDIGVLRGFLDACIHLGKVSPVLDQLKRSLAMAPDNLALLEMLGQAYLASGDLENAGKTFQQVVSQDESRYALFCSLSGAFVQRGENDQAATCIDPIIPILITRRETERAVDAYNLILKAKADHILALSKLVDIFSATNDQLRYLSTLEKLFDLYLRTNMFREAVEKAEALLQVSPDNERYMDFHQQAFEKAFPGKEYTPPAPTEIFQPVDVPAGRQGATGRGAQGTQGAEASILEIDLLLNYGMKEKALGLLQAMESADPTDKEVHIRLVSLYRDFNQPLKAAEQCLSLSALYRNVHQEEHAAKFLGEARRLAPDLAGPRFDLAAFAAEHGIMMESSTLPAESVAAEKASGNIEVDLSEDLSEIFFKDTAEPHVRDETEEIQDRHKPVVEAYSTHIPQKPSAESMQEQLQEVDFYIRLGFHDEARTKLNELASEFPDNPEVKLRYRQLEGETTQEAQISIALGPGEPEEVVPEEEGPAQGGELFQDLKIDLALEPPAHDLGGERPRANRSSTGALGSPRAGANFQTEPQPSVETGTKDKSSSMRPDPLEKVHAIPADQIPKADFETHFNLGIAYHEMDLFDDAIKEFQIAFKTLNPADSPKEVVRCCGMLSTCFLEKGMPRSTIEWCQTGLGIPEISQHESMALQYDMGVAHSQVAEDDRALRCFSFIFGIDPSYRDVAQRIDSLRGRS